MERFIWSVKAFQIYLFAYLKALPIVKGMYQAWNLQKKKKKISQSKLYDVIECLAKLGFEASGKWWNCRRNEPSDEASDDSRVIGRGSGD